MVPRLRREVAAAPPDLPLRERAGWVAYASFLGTTAPEKVAAGAQSIAAQTERLGPHERLEVMHDFQSRLDLAALAISSRCAPPTWLVRPAASALIHGTDLHAIPSEPPKLLRGPGIVEARRPETGERLWGSVASLGWFHAGDLIILLGLCYPDGYVIARWTPQWTGEDLEEQLPARDTSPLIENLDEHEAFAQAAAQYLVVLGLFAEIEDGPLRIEFDRRERERKQHDVYLRDPSPRAPAAPAPTVDPTGRVIALRPVTGHMHRYWVGPGRAKLEWRYIAEHSARRWLGPRWVVSSADDGGV